MATFSLANQILAGGPMDPRPIEANFTDTATFINDNALTLDGSKALTGALTLFGPGTADGHAVNKAQMDAADDAIVATATANATIASDATTAAIATAASDATTKADAAAVLGTADAKTYTDSVKVYTEFTADQDGVTNHLTNTIPTVILDSGSITPTKAGHAIVVVTIDVEVYALTGGALSAFSGQLKVDDVIQPDQAMIWVPNPPTLGNRQTMSQTWIVARDSGDPFDCKFEVRQVAGDGQYRIDGQYHTYMHCLMVG